MNDRNRVFAFTNLTRLAVLWLAICSTHPISADVVWINGQATPLYGRIVSSTPEQIELQVFENDKLGRIEKISRSQIEQWIVNIDTRRLEQLSPANLFEYRDFAEELASQQNDPSARSLARRLYLVAAANSTGDDDAIELRNSALAGLISIAGSSDERRRLKMLRYLVSPDDVEAGDVGDSRSVAEPRSKAQTDLMLQLVQAIRKENSLQATKLLSTQANRAVFQNWSEICSLEEMDRIARVNRPSKPQLSKLLRIELQIRSANVVNDQGAAVLPSGRRQGWGDFAMQETGILSVVPSFENVTTIDPYKSVFRNGRWSRPEIKSNE